MQPAGPVNYTGISYTDTSISILNANCQVEDGYVEKNLTNISYEEIPNTIGLCFFPNYYKDYIKNKTVDTDPRFTSIEVNNNSISILNSKCLAGGDSSAAVFNSALTYNISYSDIPKAVAKCYYPDIEKKTSMANRSF
ncbi:uncharacterized protein AC631_03454 [Debaryomyces fabryi]|uniref:Uncharacterized protein n=1 Tax=Debaryomyces fabryi TaxID=58627 RepID=A0A0V1PXL7_9ASCO|nr:uncharacterized protein AC631_03454 [Debaryomyces fabryi]KSA00805.1 hypothetical protein AC631_03454 [Debaryomyces fabryi]CUM55092.1 unnamed protein product [Debaryomyces fabryi]